MLFYIALLLLLLLYIALHYCILLYSDYSWEELGTEGVQTYFQALGWTQSFWDDETGTPASEDKDWSELTDAEREAATDVCFLESTWNEVSLADSGGDDGGGGGRRRCFSSHNFVMVQDKGLVRMDQLQIGDYVLDKSSHHDHEKYSRVYSFSHYEKDAVGDYLQIYTNNNGMGMGMDMSGMGNGPLEISKEHMLMVNGRMQKASNVQVGDILVSNAVAVAVSRIDRVQRKGMYAPVTESGSLLVNGIHASSYIQIWDNTNISEDSWSSWLLLNHQQELIHTFMAVHRGICRWQLGMTLDNRLCKNEGYTEDGGYSYWIYPMMKVVDYMEEHCSATMKVLLVLLYSPILVLGVVLEQVMLWVFQYQSNGNIMEGCLAFWIMAVAMARHIHMHMLRRGLDEPTKK